MAAGNLAVDPVMQLATIGVLGVGAKWVAWRLRVPAIVLMLGIGLLAGPLLGLLDPQAVLGDLMTPIISIAVAVILFEGLTLNFHQLRDASQGLRAWFWGGTPWLDHIGPCPALRRGRRLGGCGCVRRDHDCHRSNSDCAAVAQAKLSHRPAALLQWEAIVNDPIGALAAVLAYEVIVVSVAASTVGEAAVQLIIGLIVSSAAGVAGGYGIAQAFRRGWVPENMKVPVLFVVLIGVFVGSNALLHESGLLAVTIMGVWMRAQICSSEELRRFKERHGFVGIRCFRPFGRLNRFGINHGAGSCASPLSRQFLLARPITVYLSLLGTKILRTERTLVAFTGPRGVCWSLWRDYLANAWLPWGLQMAR